MMLITSLEKVSKTRTRVTIDYDETLVLSNKDIAAYDIRLDHELDHTVYEGILQELTSDALVRAGNLLKGMDYTSAGLSDKLIRAGYPEGIVENTVHRLQDAGYLNDRRYAENYLRIHLQDRSLTRVRMDLRRKGIGRELLTQVLETYEEESAGNVAQKEQEQIRHLLERKHYDPEHGTYEETARIKAMLLRKGYSMERILEVMDRMHSY